MSTVPPPAPPARVKPEEHRFSPAGSIVFGIAFVLLAAAIFTSVLRPLPKPEAETSPPPPPMPTLPLTYPATSKVPASDIYFGVKVADPYRWLEDGKSPEVQDWLKAENTLTRSYLDALPGRAALEKRYQQLLYIDTITAPGRAGDRFFYMKRKATQEKAVLYWCPVDNPKGEHVLIDPNEFIATTNAALGESVPTLDGKLLAYTLKPNNADEATLYVKDVASGNDLPGEVIEGAKYAGPSWMPDGSGFVYTYLPPDDPAHPEDRPGLAEVRYHKLGTDPKKDPVIHVKTGDPTKFVGAEISRDGKWMFFVQQNGWDKNDLYYQPLTGQPTAALADEWEADRRREAFSLFAFRVERAGLHPDQRGRFPLSYLQGRSRRSAP